MKLRRFLIGIFIVVLFFVPFLFIRYNGLVFVDGRLSPGVSVRFDDDGKYIFVPVVATLCELGYEKISETNDIILLQKEDKILTVDLNTLSLTCPQSPFNCIDAMPGNTYYFCERKGNDVLLDTVTFSGTLACIECDYIIELADPKIRIVKYKYFKRETMDIEQILEEHSKIHLEEKPTEEKPDVTTEASLIVNGVDITEGNCAYIHHRTQNAEIPLLAVLRALGYDINMRYNELQNCYEAVYEGTIAYTTAEQDFGIPFSIGEKDCVRKLENNDFIVDSKCIFSQMYWGWQATITVDIETSTIYIESCDPLA